MPRFHVIIPARYQSQRLPGKPLLDVGGKTMIERVVECARRSGAKSVAVATDDARIERAVRAFGAVAVMTSPRHACGADRIAEATDALRLDADEIVVNLQGDEPQMPPALIDQFAALLARDRDAAIATAMAPLDAAQWHDPSVVKVVVNGDGDALYFSRAPIPWSPDRDDDDDNGDDSRRGFSDRQGAQRVNEGAYENTQPKEPGGATRPSGKNTSEARRHLGIYAYRCGYLRRFAARGACALEARERLEQLRALWHGDRIVCADAVEVPAAGIDTPADLERVRAEIVGGG
ncbi:MAG: 3-deoxy-manno-octulosonate cytidylyltransferase [bacterium]